MTTPVVTFFNNKGGVGKTTLVYHLSWMLRELGMSVVAVDLDPQANLTASFLNDDSVEKLWSRPRRLSVYGALEPLFGVITAFSTLAQRAAAQTDARIVLVDVGPNLGAINRAVMIASDHVVIPLAPDLYSLQGLRNLGPTLTDWRDDWASHVARKPDPGLEAPAGEMRPRGYVVLQHGTRVDRVVGAYDRWLRQVPGEYRKAVLAEPSDNPPLADADEYCLGLIKHYHSLAPMAQEARRPLFLLRSADGAIGAHQRAAHEAYSHFEVLAIRLLDAVGISIPA